MRCFIFSIVLFLCIGACFSCQEKKTPTALKKRAAGGVILSFDDAYVDEWFEANKALKKYHWKGTFCVCRIDSIGAPQMEKLHQMEQEGHEIAGHGYHHYNAVKFVAQNGLNDYVQQEIDPMMRSMKKHAFDVTSFAYPYGERSAELDTVLAPKFKVIRGRAFCGNAPEKEGCYFRGSKYVYAFDIDNSHVHFSIPYLLELLDDARRTNKILVLCSHKTVKNVTDNYQTKIETLEFVCQYMKINHMKFYTLSDLDHFIDKGNL